MTSMLDEDVVVTHHITGDLDEKKARKTIAQLDFMDAEYPGSSWEIAISSPGGFMQCGNAIYSALYHYSLRGDGEHFVTTKVRGVAGSAASLVFQAGDWRVGGKMDALHMHEPMLSVDQMPLHQVKEYVGHCDQWLELYVDVVTSRSSMPRGEFYRRLVGHEWVVHMDEAVSHGFADKIA